MLPKPRLEETMSSPSSSCSEDTSLKSLEGNEEAGTLQKIGSTRAIMDFEHSSSIFFCEEDGAKAQLHALTRETYSMSLRQLRQERLSWRMDKVELNHLRKLMETHDEVLSTSIHFQTWLQEKAQDELQLEACQDEIQTLKECLHLMQTEQRDLKKEFEQVQLELQVHKDRSQHKLTHDLQASLSSDVDDSSAIQRIRDLEEQISKWETLFSESVEMGERQIQRLEEELQQVHQELEEAREMPYSESKMGETINQEHESIQLQNQVDDLETSLQQNGGSQLQPQIETTQQRHSERNEGKLELFPRSIPQETKVVSDPFIDQFHSITDESSICVRASQRQHEIKLTPSRQSIHSWKDKLTKATHTYIPLEQQTQVPAMICADDSWEDVSTSSSGHEDLKQYSLEVEQRMGANQIGNPEQEERLDHRNIVAKNHDEELLTGNQDFQKAQEATYDHSIVNDLQARLEQSNVDLEKSQALVKDLRQTLEISKQAKILALEPSNMDLLMKVRNWEQEERAKLLYQIDCQQELLDDVIRKHDASQQENAQLRQVKDLFMGIDREMKELIESLEPMQKELAEQARQVEESREEAAVLKKELNSETIKLQRVEQEKKALEVELLKTKRLLDILYIEVKEEQAGRDEQEQRVTELENRIQRMRADETVAAENISDLELKIAMTCDIKKKLHQENMALKDEVDKTKQLLQRTRDEEDQRINKETVALQESLDHHKSVLEVLQIAIHEANEEIRKSTSCQRVAQRPVSVEQELSSEDVKLQEEIFCLGKSMDANAKHLNEELAWMKQELADMESENDSHALKVSMAMNERETPEERLHKHTTNNSAKSILESQESQSELQMLQQEIEAVRLLAAQDKAKAEEIIRKLENDLNAQKLIASFVPEKENRVKRMCADVRNTGGKMSDLESRIEKTASVEEKRRELQMSVVQNQQNECCKSIFEESKCSQINFVDKERTQHTAKEVASHPLQIGRLSQKGTSVMEMIRQRNSVEVRMPRPLKVKREDLQCPGVSVKAILLNF